MPASRASASPPASGRLLTTCVTAPATLPARAWSIKAAKFEPRPEIRTVMRESAIRPVSDDHRMRRTRSTLDDGTDRLRALTGRVENAECAIRVVSRNDDDHADSAIEHAMHLGVLHVAFALQPIENRRPRPARALDACLDVVRQNARDVLDEATAGDVRDALDPDLAHQPQQRS